MLFSRGVHLVHTVCLRYYLYSQWEAFTPKMSFSKAFLSPVWMGVVLKRTESFGFVLLDHSVGSSSGGAGSLSVGGVYTAVAVGVVAILLMETVVGLPSAVILYFKTIFLLVGLFLVSL